MIRSYRELKTRYDVFKMSQGWIEKHYGDSVPEEVTYYFNECKKELKEETRDFYRHVKKYHSDPLSVPIRNNCKTWRTVADPDGDTCTDFIIIPDIWDSLWGTDEESLIYDDIEQFLHDTVYCPSYYDFPTGRMITLFWSFNRTPAGVAIIHRRGIDW